MADDPFNLRRFQDVQAPVYDQVCAELRNGEKTGHWMWFIFPQIRGLGVSYTSQKYAIVSRAEAEAYLRHEVLGARLTQCTELVILIQGRSLREIFGHPDNLKFHSSMTLFSQVSGGAPIFDAALRKYFGGRLDPLTVGQLQSE